MEGFEARGTEIANRLTAWQNLQEATRPSGPLTVNPLDDFPAFTHHKVFNTKVRLSFGALMFYCISKFDHEELLFSFIVTVFILMYCYRVTKLS